jgi:hypothetical protein
MLKPPWTPTGIKGLRASAATLHDDGLTIALPSQRRFECDFEAMYGMRVLQRQGRWYAMLDGVARTVALVMSLGFVAAFGLGRFDWAVYSGAILMLFLFMQAFILPGTQVAECRRLRSEFVAVRSEAARLTDRQYAQRLAELQAQTDVRIWRWIARSACIEVCRDLGCSVPVTRRRSSRDVASLSSPGGAARAPR